jgi:ABC-2 type transport system permease protein
MRYILRVLLNEYKAIFTDAGVVLIFLAGLTIYTMMYPLPYSTEVLREVGVVPVDQDHSSLSRKLMRWADATEEVRLAAPANDLAEAQRRVLNAEASGIFLIQKGFETDILRGKQAVVSVYADACYFLIYRQIVTGLYKATATMSAGVEVRRYTAAGLGEEEAKRARDPLPIVMRALFNPAGGYATYVVPAVLILIMQQTLLIGIGMLGGTRNEAFMKSPPPPGKRESYLATLIGRGFAYFSIYLFYPLYYVYVIFWLYNLPHTASAAQLVLFMVPFVLAITYLGLSLNALFKSRELSIPVLISTSVPALFLIGFAWPYEAMPRWLINIGMLLPSTTGCAGFIRLNEMGAAFHDVLPEWFTLWGLCGFYFVIAWLTMHRRHPESAQG